MSSDKENVEGSPIERAGLRSPMGVQGGVGLTVPQSCLNLR